MELQYSTVELTVLWSTGLNSGGDDGAAQQQIKELTSIKKLMPTVKSDLFGLTLSLSLSLTQRNKTELNVVGYRPYVWDVFLGTLMRQLG